MFPGCISLAASLAFRKAHALWGWLQSWPRYGAHAMWGDACGGSAIIHVVHTNLTCHKPEWALWAIQRAGRGFVRPRVCCTWVTCASWDRQPAMSFSLSLEWCRHTKREAFLAERRGRGTFRKFSGGSECSHHVIWDSPGRQAYWKEVKGGRRREREIHTHT